MDLNVQQLQKNTFFSHFNEAEIKKILDHGAINRHMEGEVIFFEGDDGEAMYILLTGEVEILIPNSDGMEEVLAILKPGDVFGEGSFATGSRRTAKAMATKRSYLYVVTSDHLYQLIEKESKITAKMMLELLKIVCGRLKVTNTRLTGKKNRD